MRNEKITYRLHSVKRMFEQEISAEEVRYMLETGEAIEEYPDDTPYPSRLILGCYKGRIIHIVAANNRLDEEIIVITVSSQIHPNGTRNARRGFDEMHYLQKSIY